MSARRAALLIASNVYDDPGLSQLAGPGNDVAALAEVLSDPSIGRFDVTIIEDQSSYTIRTAIESFFDKRNRDDLLLLYISGHGIKDVDGRLYFAAQDTHRDRLRSTGIPSTFVNEVMAESRARKQLLLLDCCFSGAFARGMTIRATDTVGAGDYFRNGRGSVIITASDAIHYAFESASATSDAVQSLFTRHLIHGLQTGAADQNGDGVVTSGELYDYVFDQVIKQEDARQRPQKWVFNLEGDIIVAHAPDNDVQETEESSSLPQRLHRALADPDVRVREALLPELQRMLYGRDEHNVHVAMDALKQLALDDSRAVSLAAVALLQAYVNVQRRQSNIRRMIADVEADSANDVDLGINLVDSADSPLIARPANNEPDPVTKGETQVNERSHVMAVVGMALLTAATAFRLAQIALPSGKKSTQSTDAR